MRRRSKLVVALLLLGASMLVVLWNTSAQTAPPALGVADAKRSAHERADQAVTVRGTVAEGTILESDGRLVEFVLADSLERLRVVYNATPPDGFGAKEAVVRGSLAVDDGGTPYLRAESIQVGCASKY